MLTVLSRARKALGGAVVALSALALAACEPVANTGAAPGASRGQVVQVALLVPAGSGQASQEELAKSLENAARLAMADLGAGTIALQVYPTAGSPDRAVSQARQAVEDGADVILGPVFAQEANAVGQAVASAGVDVLAFSNNTAIAGGNVFVLGQTFENTADRLAQYAVRNNAGRVVIAYDQNSAGETGRDAIAGAVQRAGGQVLASEGYPFSQNGVSTRGPAIAQSVKDRNANAVFLTADTAGALPTITQTLRDNGLTPEMVRFIGLTRWDVPTRTASLPGVQGGWFALPDPSVYGQFVQRYQGAYGMAPHPIAGLAYDGIAAIGALAKRGSPITTQTLTRSSGFAGTGGVFRLLANGTNERGLAVAQISNNQVNVIDPAPRSFGGFGF
ncbi:penicillin-binding protein activator [Falsirhodobacter algicola]|uniref:ABC transporter substrate-binding protein n=1 Tax=Falsirhodobacter algicola TaxID=2692330 RepID=A0A8J8SJV1_9RHOB|nr:penicillin-binding protein activator [Falsirhodobacter algicola]QUS34826.1 ABC transporter substrate-binding protein [Falsirhodobacter algicola]